jgi:dynactin complex subunit
MSKYSMPYLILNIYKLKERKNMTEKLNELKDLYNSTNCNRIKVELFFRIIELKKQIAVQNAVNNDVGIDYV